MERTCGEASTAPAPRRTVLLIGPTGAGKSATANALLGLPGTFVSRRHVAGVTQEPAIATSTSPADHPTTAL
jgi:predicted GTPase